MKWPKFKEIIVITCKGGHRTLSVSLISHTHAQKIRQVRSSLKQILIQKDTELGTKKLILIACYPCCLLKVPNV